MNEVDVPKPNLIDVIDPKIDIHYTNGSLKGKFNLKFKQHIFNWVIATLVSSCGAHGVYLHYHEQDLEKTIIDQQKIIVSAQVEVKEAQTALQQVQLLLTQKSIATQISPVGIQDNSKPKQ